MRKLSFLVCILTASLCTHAQPNNTRLNSPEILSDNSVIFRIKAPDATDVKVVGTWARDFKPVPMIKK